MVVTLSRARRKKPSSQLIWIRGDGFANNLRPRRVMGLQSAQLRLKTTRFLIPWQWIRWLAVGPSVYWWRSLINYSEWSLFQLLFWLAKANRNHQPSGVREDTLDLDQLDQPPKQSWFRNWFFKTGSETSNCSRSNMEKLQKKTCLCICIYIYTCIYRSM